MGATSRGCVSNESLAKMIIRSVSLEKLYYERERQRKLDIYSVAKYAKVSE